MLKRLRWREKLAINNGCNRSMGYTFTISIKKLVWCILEIITLKNSKRREIGLIN